MFKVGSRVLGHVQLRKKMLFTAKINSDAFLFVLSDIPHGLPQRITCCMAVVPYQLSIMVAMFF